MHIFKTKPHIIEAIAITEHNFEMATRKEAPYYNKNIMDDGETRYVAVCPACDNPIIMVNFYKGTKNQKPHARHFTRSIPHLVSYNQENFDCCVLASHSKTLNRDSKKQTLNQLSLDIIKLLIEQFDRVIYLLSKVLGIKITAKLAETMLINYIAEQGYLYRYASLHNIPWIFAYFADSQSLVYRIINDNDALKAVILEKTTLILDENNKVVNPIKNNFAELTFFFTKHRVKQEDIKVIEQMDLIVSYNKNIIYKQTIEFDGLYFSNLIHQEGNEDKRNQTMLKLAKDICLANLPEYIIKHLELSA